MKNLGLFIFSVFALVAVHLHAQGSSTLKFDLSGFVRADMFFDSRQTTSLRDNAIMVAPKPELLDGVGGSDLNAAPNMTMLAFHTRLAGKASGIEALGASVIGYMEGEFFGMSDADVNGFRLRHAYVKFDWENSSLMFGQFWHPMFSTEVIPSFNFAAPFIPYSRNPQIRFVQKFNSVSFQLTALTQRDFLSNGPDESSITDMKASVKNNIFLKNAAMPMLDFEVLAKPADNLFFGAGFDYKSLQPRLKGLDGKKTTEKISSIAFTAYCKAEIAKDFLFKFQGVYGQNLADITMPGGYSMTAADSSKYTNLNALSFWSEFCYGKSVTYNLFIGYAANLGADDNIYATKANKTYYYAFLQDIKNLIRIAPNVSFFFSKLKLTCELDYTSASYGTNDRLDKAKVINTTKVNNIRFAISSMYAF